MRIVLSFVFSNVQRPVTLCLCGTLYKARTAKARAPTRTGAAVWTGAKLPDDSPVAAEPAASVAELAPLSADEAADAAPSVADDAARGEISEGSQEGGKCWVSLPEPAPSVAEEAADPAPSVADDAAEPAPEVSEPAPEVAEPTAPP